MFGKSYDIIRRYGVFKKAKNADITTIQMKEWMFHWKVLIKRICILYSARSVVYICWLDVDDDVH